MKAELDIVWAEGHKLRAERDRLWAEGERLRVEYNRLWAEHSKLHAEGDIVWVEGTRLWFDAVHRICGPDVSIEWLDGGGCLVAGVMEFLKQTKGD